MITDFFTTLFIIYRSEWMTDINGNAYSAEFNVGDFHGHIQQADASLVASLGLNLTNTYSIWCPVNTDIRNGDTIESADGQYSVKAIQLMAIGDNKHIQAIVQLDGVPRGS